MGELACGARRQDGDDRQSGRLFPEPQRLRTRSLHGSVILLRFIQILQSQVLTPFLGKGFPWRLLAPLAVEGVRLLILLVFLVPLVANGLAFKNPAPPQPSQALSHETP